MSESSKFWIVIVFFVFIGIVMLVKRYNTASIMRGFHEALKNNDTEKAKYFLQKIKDPNFADPKSGWSILFSAAFYGNAEIVSILLNRGANATKASVDKGETPLHIAVMNGQVEATKVFLNFGVDPNIQDYDNRTPIFYVRYTDNNYEELIRLLVSKGADLNVVDKGGDSLLLLAICQAIEIEAQGLLTEDDVKNARSSWDLSLATLSHTKELMHAFNRIKALIAAGADINFHVHYKNMTPLMTVCMAGYEDIAKILCEKGAKIDDIDENGDTSLMYACRKNYPKIVRLLVENKCNKNIENHDGKTALEIAEEEGYKEIVKILK